MMTFRYFFSLLMFLCVLPSAKAENRSWTSSYIKSGELVKQDHMADAAQMFYRAKLASNWSKVLRPSAFVPSGDSPGTFRQAMDSTLGETIGPWLAQDLKARLVPILDLLTQEVDAIKTDQDLSLSFYSGAISSPEEEKAEKLEVKYPLEISRQERLSRFKAFATSWIMKRRVATGVLNIFSGHE